MKEKTGRGSGRTGVLEFVGYFKKKKNPKTLALILNKKKGN